LDKMRETDFLQEQLKLHATGKGMCRTGITSFAYFSLETASPSEAPSMIKSLEAEIDMRKANAPPGLKEQWDLQLEILRNEKLPDLEIVVVPAYMIASTPFEKGKSYITMELISQHPFSRGTIHAKSKDPLENPLIDPKMFDFDYDLESMVTLMEYTRSLKTVEPWKSAVRKELDPAPNATHEELRDYIKKRSGPCWHAVGSCSMLPREKNGVVDSKLKVYGTTNLRVADLSIIPLHISAHTQATAYVIGEKAADFVTGKMRV